MDDGMTAPWARLTEAQRASSRAVIEREGALRCHVVVALSGAHAYGFPSPDSDVDLKAVHVAPTAGLLGLHPSAAPADRLEVLDGVEMDYTSNELGGVLAGILKGNGNYLERVLGASSLAGSPWLEALRPLVRGALSRRVHRHYRGFALGQRREFDEAPTAKKLLYVLRTALTGAHLLRSGELVLDVTALLDDYGLGAAHALVEAKRAGERAVLPEGERARWVAEVERALLRLDEAHEASALPEAPGNEAELDAWLIEVRRAML